MAAVLGGAALFGTATSAAAECTSLDPWPSFRDAARTADRIVVGQVVHGYDDDSTDHAIRFRFRVDEVLRGRSSAVIDFRDAVQPPPPLTVCPGDSVLRVKVADAIAFAFDARVAGPSDRVLAVAFIRGTPDEFLMPGMEQLTLAQVRSLAALPPTETVN